jgi:hypothetical protein
MKPENHLTLLSLQSGLDLRGLFLTNLLGCNLKKMGLPNRIMCKAVGKCPILSTQRAKTTFGHMPFHITLLALDKQSIFIYLEHIYKM